MKRCLNCNTKFSPKRRDALYCSTHCRVAGNRRVKRNKDVTDNSEKIILSLCDRSGVWSAPYARAGYTVKQVDLSLTNPQDVRLLKFPNSSIYGILAAPPCTVFAISGNRWIRTDEELINGLSVVDACLRLVVNCKPKFWALENPVGKLKHYLGDPKWYFHPCDYGDPWTKRTCLWGEFNKPKPCPVKPTLGSITAKISSYGEKTKGLRSLTPLGFAQAFFLANQ